MIKTPRKHKKSALDLAFRFTSFFKLDGAPAGSPFVYVASEKASSLTRWFLSRESWNHKVSLRISLSLSLWPLCMASVICWTVSQTFMCWSSNSRYLGMWPYSEMVFKEVILLENRYLPLENIFYFLGFSYVHSISLIQHSFIFKGFFFLYTSIKHCFSLEFCSWPSVLFN